MGKHWKRDHKTKLNESLGRRQGRRGRAWADPLGMEGGEEGQSLSREEAA